MSLCAQDKRLEWPHAERKSALLILVSLETSRLCSPQLGFEDLLQRRGKHKLKQPYYLFQSLLDVRLTVV